MHIHFIGIGGIGVSALANYYLKKGHQISGSDLVSSEITEALKEKGAKLLIGKHKAKNLPKDADLVIYSPAVPKNNPELKSAINGGPTSIIMSYPEALGELTKKYFTIAISGTHGKSSVTAMIGLILVKAGLDPTVIVGTKIKEFAPRQKNGEGSNCRVGKSKYLVIEADEWQASFLNYWPKIVVLTNIEREHLDFYKNLGNILKTFEKFVSRLPKNGTLVANRDDLNSQKIIRDRISKGNPISLYRLNQKGTKKLKEILKIPGEHNISNALAALTAARVLKIPDKVSFKALSEYRGAWRRFEVVEADLRGFKRGLTRKITIVSDYGHHPTEIRATLSAAREKFPKKKIWSVFQPHQYQRTFYLFKDFVKTFKTTPIDKLIIIDIYDVAGREEKKIKKQISSEKLIKAINKPWAVYLSTIEKAKSYLKKNLKGGEVVIIMGAGDIYKLADSFST